MLALLRLAYGAFFIVVAGVMLAVPRSWYDTLPGVADRGAFNPHFVRDIGVAFLVAGSGFVAGGLRPLAWRPAMFAGAGFILLHAAVHLVEEVSHAHGRSFLRTDLPSVYIPAALALWLLLADVGRGAATAQARHRPDGR